VLALAGRHAADHTGPSSLLWCTTRAAARETGTLYGPGLARFGLCLTRIIVLEAAREDDALWAFEEGLRCASFGLVAGCFAEVALTPARRLALAARDGGTPGLVLTRPAAAAAGAMASRWRAGPLPSGPHPFDAKAPGAARFDVTLERSRAAPARAHTRILLEWSDETHRFHMAAAVADREAAAAGACKSAG
jgi:protein ImuA